jgi:hypothetical protein
MKALLSDIQFAQPVFLWLLLGLPILWLRFRVQKLLVLLARTLILLLLICGLADPQRIIQKAQQEERIVAFDLSASVTNGMRRWMEVVAQRDLILTPTDRVFVFASDAKETPDWREWLNRDGAHPDGIQPTKTSLEKLFSTILALPPAPRSLFLFTDGWETLGNVEPLLPAIATSGLKVFPVISKEQPRIDNIAVKRVVLPNQGKSGESVNLKVLLENQSTVEVEGTLVLTRNNQNLKSESIKVLPGSQVYTYPTTLPDNPMASYRAQFNPRRQSQDTNPADNQALAWVTVKTKAKVLLLNGQASDGQALRPQHLQPDGDASHRGDVEVLVEQADEGADRARGIVVLGLAQQQGAAPLDVAQVDIIAQRGAPDPALRVHHQHQLRFRVAPARRRVNADPGAGSDRGHGLTLGEHFGIGPQPDFQVL